jgi:hypothetical protein
LSNFSIFDESGGLWTAVDKTFPVTLSSPGPIKIVFDAVFGPDGAAIGLPKVDAIEIARAGLDGGVAD